MDFIYPSPLWGKSSRSPSLWDGTLFAGRRAYLMCRQSELSPWDGCVCENRSHLSLWNGAMGSLTLTKPCTGGDRFQGQLCLTIKLQNGWYLMTLGAAARGSLHLRSHRPLLHRHLLTAVLSLKAHSMGYRLHPGGDGRGGD